MIVALPSEDDLDRIHDQYAEQLPHLRPLIQKIKYKHDKKDYVGFEKSMKLEQWELELENRWTGVVKSYLLLMFYFEKGIPDWEWTIQDGPAIVYFPHFEEEHFHIKDWFDYFSDVFYYKLFSSLDIVSHILNIWFDVGIKNQTLVVY
jgi:hypothetical protein